LRFKAPEAANLTSWRQKCAVWRMCQNQANYFAETQIWWCFFREL